MKILYFVLLWVALFLFNCAVDILIKHPIDYLFNIIIPSLTVLVFVVLEETLSVSDDK